MTTALVPPASTRSTAVVGDRPCVRPGCTRMATSTLRFDYSERTVMLDPLSPRSAPGSYDLCFAHAARSTPPTGWSLRDRVPSRSLATEPPPPVGPDRGHGVARLAAALSAVPRAVSEDAPDAAPVGTDRSVGQRSPLDNLLRPSMPQPSPQPSPQRDPQPPAHLETPAVTVRAVPLSELTPTADVRPVPQPLRLAPDPTTTVWCADLLAGPERPAPATDLSPSVDGDAPTLFA